MSSRVQTSNWPLPANGLRFVTPPRLRRTLATHALTRGCYPLAMGFYPEACGHQMQRAQPDDYLLIYCRAGSGSQSAADDRAIAAADRVADDGAGATPEQRSPNRVVGQRGAR